MSFWSTVSDIFSGGKNPANAAMPYLNQIPQIGQQYYSPYIKGGQNAGNLLNEQYQRLLNPTSFMDELLKNYQESEGAKYQENQLNKEIGANAAAGGIAGTPEHQRQAAEMTQGILSKDMQQYLQNALGIYGGGIQGEQDIFNKGYGASGSLADLLGGTLNAQAGLAYQGQNQQNQNQNALVNALLGLAGKGAGGLFNYFT